MPWLTLIKKDLNISWNKSYESMTQKTLKCVRNIMVRNRLGGSVNNIWDLVLITYIKDLM